MPLYVALVFKKSVFKASARYVLTKRTVLDLEAIKHGQTSTIRTASLTKITTPKILVNSHLT